MSRLNPDHSFPFFTDDNHHVTSPKTPLYNCIAWAAGDDRHWWWPAPGCYWPDNAPQQETIDSFVVAFGSLGYVICNDYNFEQGYEKVVLYALNGKPTHMARQIADGSWASKLGKSFDIEHQHPDVVTGNLYGASILVMRRVVLP